MSTVANNLGESPEIEECKSKFTVIRFASLC